MSESNDESEVREVKIADIKDKLIEEDYKNNLLKRKTERKKNKKKKRKDLLNKYKDEINQIIDEAELKNEHLLIQKKKTKNTEITNKSKKIYHKKGIRIQISSKKENYPSITQDVLDFKNHYYYGNGISREKNFLGKI